MALAGSRIEAAFASGAWRAYRDAEPVDEVFAGPNSIDVHLGKTILEVRAVGGHIDPHDCKTMETLSIDLERNNLILMPGRLYLGSVQESFDCSAPLEGKHYYQVLDGRSTCGRIGLCVHSTAGRGDYGWGGRYAQFTLELTCTLPILIREGMRLAQVYFEEVQGVQEGDFYSGAYSTQIGPRAAELGRHRF